MPSQSGQVETVLAAGDVVGESVVWDDRTGALIWVDIGGRRIQRLVLATGEHTIWPVGFFPTSIGLRTDGGAIVGRTQDVALWEFGGNFRVLAIPEPGRPLNRLNEGRVAPDGSFWVGTMANNLTPAGALNPTTERTGHYYRVTADGEVTRLSDDAYGITNTMVWLDDGRFVTADTTLNQFYAYRVEDGLLTDRQDFTPPLDRGLPDGSCRDAEGGVWTCRVVGGYAVARTMPDGTVDRVIDLPCSWPTSCTFGGDDLGTLYVTSARFTMTREHLAANPQEGSLFAVRPGVVGLRENRFAGGAA
jgi:sugar lactone lactonase YvrE